MPVPHELLALHQPGEPSAVKPERAQAQCEARCGTCKQTRGALEFVRSDLLAGRLRCRACNSERARTSRARRRARQGHGVWRAKLCTLRARHRAAAVAALTPEALERVYEAQGGVCALSGLRMSEAEAAAARISSAGAWAPGNVALVSRWMQHRINKPGFQWDEAARRRIAAAAASSSSPAEEDEDVLAPRRPVSPLCF